MHVRTFTFENRLTHDLYVWEFEFQIETCLVIGLIIFFSYINKVGKNGSKKNVFTHPMNDVFQTSNGLIR